MLRRAILVVTILFAACSTQDEQREARAETHTSDATQSASACVPFSPASVSLVGRMVTEHRFGPPTFGENAEVDERIRVPFLLPDEYVRMCDDTKGLPSTLAALPDMDSVQLNLTRVSGDSMPLLNHSVRVFGRISRAESGYHFVDVYMMVDSAHEHIRSPTS